MFGYSLIHFFSQSPTAEGDNQNNSMVQAALKEEEMDEIDQKDDGYIELVLRVLARMCDGQHKGLQVIRHKESKVVS